MVQRLRRHLRTNVVGYIALMVAVVGMPSAYALGQNTIGSAQLKKGAVKASDLAKNASARRR